MLVSLGLLIVRVVVGLTLAGHGAQKLFGWWGGSGMSGWIAVVTKLRIRPAAPWAWIAALSEFGGGLLFALGLLSPLGSLAIAGTMFVAIATVHWANGFWNTKRGYEFNRRSSHQSSRLPLPAQEPTRSIRRSASTCQNRSRWCSAPRLLSWAWEPHSPFAARKRRSRPNPRPLSHRLAGSKPRFSSSAR